MHKDEAGKIKALHAKREPIVPVAWTAAPFHQKTSSPRSRRGETQEPCRAHARRQPQLGRSRSVAPTENTGRGRG